MGKNKLVYFLVILSIIVLFSITFNTLKLTGNILLDLKDNFEKGENLTGKLNLKLTDIPEDALAIILLTKDNKGIESQIISVKKLKENSVQINVETYSIELEKIINYTFEEPGQYELTFSILEKNINEKRKITIS